MPIDMTDTAIKLGIGGAVSLAVKFAYDHLTAGKKYVTKEACSKAHGICEPVTILRRDFDVYKASNTEKMDQHTKELAEVHATVKSSAQDISELSTGTAVIVAYMKAKGLIPNDLEP